MRSAVLFSGGKDSTLALHYALQSTEVKCLISIISENPESFMFHTPNIKLVKKQAECIGLPLILQKTKGVKEKELSDLETVLKKAKQRFRVEAVFTGALASVYQASRVQKICETLGLKCVNPLWQKSPKEIWNELLKKGFEVIIVGVSAAGLEQKWLGKKIDLIALEELNALSQKFDFNLAFEGGEAETFVTDCPVFKRKIIIVYGKKIWFGNCGTYAVEKVKLVGK